MAQSLTSVAGGSAWHVRDAAKVAATLRVVDPGRGPRKPMSPAPYEKACEEAACGRRGNQSRSDGQRLRQPFRHRASAVSRGCCAGRGGG
jgi:hypothetical protein